MKIIYEYRNSLKVGLGTTTFCFGGIILTRCGLQSCGQSYTIRLWWTFGVHTVGVELPVTLLITLLRRLLVGTLVLGDGFGKALLRAGKHLKEKAGNWVGHIMNS